MGRKHMFIGSNAYPKVQQHLFISSICRTWLDKPSRLDGIDLPSLQLIIKSAMVKQRHHVLPRRRRKSSETNEQAGSSVGACLCPVITTGISKARQVSNVSKSTRATIAVIDKVLDLAAWNDSGRNDWSALPKRRKTWYENRAMAGTVLDNGHEPPRATNDWAVPPTQAEVQAAAAAQANLDAQAAADAAVAQANLDAQVAAAAAQAAAAALNAPVSGTNAMPGEPSPPDVPPIITPNGTAIPPENAAGPANPNDNDLPGAVPHGLPTYIGNVDGAGGNPAQPPSWNWDDPGDWHESNNPQGLPNDALPFNQGGVHDREKESSTLGATEMWRKIQHLGEGGFGSVSLWVKYDINTSNVLDRVAIKDSSYAAPEMRAGWWDTGRLWPNYPDKAVPCEVVALRVLNKPPACSYVVTYRGFRMYPDNMATYRVYMPPAEFGSGWSFLIKWCHDDAGIQLQETESVKAVPATFLLDMLAAMLTAGKHMHERNVLHNDIKLPNILFVADDGKSPMVGFAQTDAPMDANDVMNPDGWGIHPVFTDFGLSLPEKSTAFRNPEDLITGTKGTLPPEQKLHEPPPPLTLIIDAEERRVSEKSMVFGIAATFFQVRIAKGIDCYSDYCIRSWV